MTGPDEPVAAGRRAAWTKALKVVAVVLVLAFAGAFVVGSWSSIVVGIRRLTWWSVALAFCAALAGLGVSALASRASLLGLGSPLGLRPAARVYYLSQLGKYVPGSVWPVVAQAELSTEYGVPRTRAGLGVLTHMLVSLVVGGIVATGSLAAAGLAPSVPTQLLVLLAAIGVVLLLPPVFNLLLRTVSRLLRRARPERMAARGLLELVAWSVVMWLAFGVQLWVLAVGQGQRDPDLFLASMGAYALAWVVGFLVFFLPAGAGAREAALVVTLAPIMSSADALSLALVSRVLMLVADFALALTAVHVEKRRLASRAGRPAVVAGPEAP